MKYLLSLLLGIAFSLQIVAQDYKFEIGVQGGPSISNVTYKYDKKNYFSGKDPAISFMAGMFVQYNLSKNFALRMDPGFEQKGYNYTSTYTNQNGIVLGEYKTTTRFNYITVPVLLRAGIGNKVRYFINAGPYVSFLLSNKYKNSYDNTSINYTKRYTTADIGITAGIGLAVPVNERISFSVELRNNFGIYNIEKSDRSMRSTKTFSANMLCGISYAIGK